MIIVLYYTFQRGILYYLSDRYIDQLNEFDSWIKIFNAKLHLVIDQKSPTMYKMLKSYKLKRCIFLSMRLENFLHHWIFDISKKSFFPPLSHHQWFK